VGLEITYDPRQFRLRVRDDGRGFDPKILEDGGRPDHWGFKECENARRRPESGTEVELTVPETTAYQAGHPKSIAAWFRGFSGSDGEQL